MWIDSVSLRFRLVVVPLGLALISSVPSQLFHNMTVLLEKIHGAC